MTSGKVAIVGAGLIGRAWAVAFARGGCDVALTDARAGAGERALEAIEGTLEALAAQDLLGGEAPAGLRARMSAAEDLEAAVADAVLVQENTPEDVEIKRAVTADIAAAAGPTALLASSTSSIVPSLYSEAVPGRERCFVAHPINPPHLVPAVELVSAPWTDPGVIERAAAFYAAIGQAPIRVNKEIEGFIVNRLQGALLHEAFRILAGGYASAADIDLAISQGLGLRWSFMGPFETIDLNAPGGIRDYIERYGGLYQRMAESQREPADWQALLDDGLEGARIDALPRGRHAERSLWRDRRLMALAAHKAHSDSEFGT